MILFRFYKISENYVEFFKFLYILQQKTSNFYSVKPIFFFFFCDCLAKRAQFIENIFLF